VTIEAGEFFHPSQLAREVHYAIGRADVVVIDVGAFFVATAVGAVDVSRLPRWVTATNARIRHLRDLRGRLLAAYPRGDHMVELVETYARALAKNALRPLIREYPRPTVKEYEDLLQEAVSRLQAANVRLVLQGPGGFNPDEMGPKYAPDTPRIYDDINAMARRVAAARQVPIVDRVAIGQGHPALFLPATSRYSGFGHRLMGEALADELLRDDLV
jgi:hypothetical protein